jgi:hypothetical protein
VAALAGAGSTRRTIFTHRGAAARRPLAYSVVTLARILMEVRDPDV